LPVTSGVHGLLVAPDTLCGFVAGLLGRGAGRFVTTAKPESGRAIRSAPLGLRDAAIVLLLAANAACVPFMLAAQGDALAGTTLLFAIWSVTVTALALAARHGQWNDGGAATVVQS
jgi:hypothetical protein